MKQNQKYIGNFYTTKRILKFPRSEEIISDDDVMSLFLGLARLIKKSAEIKSEERYLSTIVSLKKEIEYLKSRI